MKQIDTAAENVYAIDFSLRNNNILPKVLKRNNKFLSGIYNVLASILKIYVFILLKQITSCFSDTSKRENS